jgi:SAM-dependent methyltransferase
LEAPTSGISQEVSPDDSEYAAGVRAHYFNVGQSALRCIRLALVSAQKTEINRILDLPCGYGRVLRALKAEFPGAQITACDLKRDAVQFCVRTFGVLPVISQQRARDIEIQQRFDLIWCGSLLTHLNSNAWSEFLGLFDALLDRGGVLVFTTHGRWVAERMRRGRYHYELSEEQIRSLLDDYDRQGFGYQNYSSALDYGISVASPSWTCLQLETLSTMRLVAYKEATWDDHQDVIACCQDDRIVRGTPRTGGPYSGPA